MAFQLAGLRRAAIRRAGEVPGGGGGGGEGGAPLDASYVTTSANAELTNETILSSALSSYATLAGIAAAVVTADLTTPSILGGSTSGLELGVTASDHAAGGYINLGVKGGGINVVRIAENLSRVGIALPGSDQVPAYPLEVGGNIKGVNAFFGATAPETTLVTGDAAAVTLSRNAEVYSVARHTGSDVEAIYGVDASGARFGTASAHDVQVVTAGIVRATYKYSSTASANYFAVGTPTAIANTNPSPLRVFYAGEAYLTFRNTANSIEIAVGAASSAALIGTFTGHDIVVLTGANEERMRIKHNVGSGGIGTLFSARTFAQSGSGDACTNIETRYTVNQSGGATGVITGFLLNATETAVLGVHNLADFQVGGTSKFKISNAGLVTKALAAIANGGGAAPTLGTIGGSGPTAAAQAGWEKVILNGVTSFRPIWT